MRSKQIITFILCVALLINLTACGEQQTQIPAKTVDNLFTQPITETTENTQMNTADNSGKYSDLATPRQGTYGFVPASEKEEEGGYAYFPYRGGEFHYKFEFTNLGFSFDEFGLGFLLFVGGIPQPYHMTEGQEDAYMQIIYPENSIDNLPAEYEFIFTPATGNKGEFVEFSIFMVWYPWYYAEASKGIQATSCMAASHVRLYFEEDPLAQTVPERFNRLSSYSVSYEDLTDADIAGYSSAELNSILDWSFSADGKAQGIHYNITENDTVNIHYELFGCKEMEYSLILFADNEPVYTDPAQTHVVVRSGEKTVIDVQVDLSDFDGRCLVYAVLVCRNYWELSSQGVAFSGPSIIASYSVYYVSEASFS